MPAFFSFLLLDPRPRKWRLRLAFALYTAILILGSVRGARAELGQYATGIVLHTLAYGGLTLLMYTGTQGTARARALTSVLCIAAMGAIDELVQSALPYRVGSLQDWLVDCNAALIVAALLWAFLPAPAASR